MPNEDQSIMWQLDKRIDQTSDRISAIEGELKKRENSGPIKKLSEVGGLIALFISVAIGGFTIHEELVVKPEIEAQQHENSIRNAISEMSKIQGELVSIDWKNDPAAQAKLGAYAPRRLALLKKVTDTPIASREYLDFADYLMVSREFAQFGNIEKSEAYLSLAESKAIDAPQRAAVHLMWGRVAAFKNNFLEMDDFFEKAVKEYLSQGVKISAFDLLNTHIEWIGINLGNTLCSNAQNVHVTFIELLNHDDVWPLVKKQAEKTFNEMLPTQKSKCALMPIT